ncbi:MAG: ribonucleoside-diphosphate reductase subunit alpha [Anaerorhabdus sp.]|uniref:ribonucleoside-diphosphate reductase subunit alpha n=1 Tax=Anaerorhabdus sp. TaxID=1872524 RepID=UPI003A8B6254
MIIIKRNGSFEEFNQNKIIKAVEKAFQSIPEQPYSISTINSIAQSVMSTFEGMEEISVEQVQNSVEEDLMKAGYFQVAKNYILYRESRARKREYRKSILMYFDKKEDIENCLRDIERSYPAENYSLEFLSRKFYSYVKEGLSDEELFIILVKAAAELVVKEAPDWEFIAARILLTEFNRKLLTRSEPFENFYEKLRYLTEKSLYGEYILENYTREEINIASTFIDESRNTLLNYSGLDLLLKRYVISDYAKQPLETPQEMFLGIALHLAMNETENRLYYVGKFYDMLSTLKVTMATPTLSNARKPLHQLSSCFIDTVPDSLDGIYRSIENFAKVSKLGGGMGMYFGKVRSKGGSIRGFEGAAGGVIRWLKLVNDTAVAVDQLGVRQGAVAVYLDIWHKDIPEFLQIRTNNGDDRLKAHDIFPAICYPDYFFEQIKTNLDGDWYLLDPHEVLMIKGYCLEDFYGNEWQERYLDCIHDGRISKRSIPIKELVRMIIKSAVETGTPFAFYRDAVNRMNPNPHKGMIYCSNLCTEIAQNMSEIKQVNQEIVDVQGEVVVVTTTKPGDFVVCNLASLSLGKINVNDDVELQETIELVVRALDNVIDLNYFPLPYAKVNNLAYRPIGLGVSGYHHMLAKNGIRWESEEHLNFADKIFEKINYFTLQASLKIAKEKGAYSYFKGSDFDNGNYFTKRNYFDEKWIKLRDEIHRHGIRNGYLLAIAPTSSTSIIANTTAGLDPIMDRFFLEEKKNGLIPRVAPELSPKTYWLYKNAHLIDQQWSVKACGIRQRHVDQAMSMNIYITNDYTFKKILDLYILAYEMGVKTIYYVRSRSLDIEDCESCSA